MFADEWLMKEHNYKLLDTLLQWLTDPSMVLDERRREKKGQWHAFNWLLWPTRTHRRPAARF